MIKMPVAEESRGNQNIDFKQKYRNLKRKLKLLLYENECYNEELRKCQKQLLEVNRDKSFLLDKLLIYENIDSTTSDSDATDSSDSDNELTEDEKSFQTKRKKTSQGKETNQTKLPGKNINQQTSVANVVKKKKVNNSTSVTRSKGTNQPKISTTVASTTSTSTITSTMVLPSNSNKGNKNILNANQKPSITNQTFTSKQDNISSTSTITVMIPSSSTSTSTTTVSSSSCDQLLTNPNDNQLSKEELERHFESRLIKQSLLMPEKAPLTVPTELFSNESSNGLPDDKKF